MLWQDQRALNGLLFERHIADRLKREEFSTSLAIIDSVGPAPRARGVPPRPTAMLTGFILVVVGVGVLFAENVWLLGAPYAGASLVAGWMSLGLLLMVCGALTMALGHVTSRFKPRTDAVQIARSASRPDVMISTHC